MLDKGARGAHRYCNAVNQPIREATQVASDGTLQISSLVDDQCSAWYPQWCAQGDSEAYLKFVDKVREKALLEPFDERFWRSRVHAESIARASNSIRDNSSSDQLSTKLVGCLP